MSDKLLTTMVPESMVGVAIVSVTDGVFRAVWRDVTDSVPTELRVAAQTLRALADELQAESDRMATQ